MNPLGFSDWRKSLERLAHQRKQDYLLRDWEDSELEEFHTLDISPERALEAMQSAMMEFEP